MSSVNSEASLPNSQSNPPPHRPKVSKMLSVQVHFLDDSVMVFHVQQKAFGRVLFEQVCKTLSLLEVDYFGLEYTDSGGSKYWLDYEKPLCRQMGLSMVTPTMYFCVKFYTPDPAQLEEEYTRYIYSLQIKRDLAQGVLQCNDNTAALMASYIVQAECGDYEADDYPDHTYLSSFKFVPHQDAEFERKIMENHKKHVGQSPAEADLNLLETARRCELYGIRMTPAKDHEGVPLNLATAHMGVLVFQNYTKINTFSWAKIRKLSFKRKKFLIKLHPEGYGYYQDTVEFFFEGRNECKNFWKKCIEHHGFFRCAEVRPLPRQKARIFSRGSSFRYSGRTQKQIVEYVRENYIKRQPFQRSTSLRVSSTARNSLGKVGTSISAQPLLPVCDTQSSTSVTPNVEAAGASSHPPCEETREQRPASVSPAHEERPAIANGTICTNGRRTPQDSLDHLPGLETPDLGQDSEGLRSPDFLGNDTDDNISHDSYHLDEREEPVDQRCDLQDPQNSPCSDRPAKNTPSPQHQLGTNSREYSEATSLSTRGFSSDDDATWSPTSPARSFRDHSSIPTSPRSELESEAKLKRIPVDTSYFIVKEMLMTERTYKKDLELVNVWFREEVSKRENMPKEVLALLFGLLDPIYECHCSFLTELEQRLAIWEGKCNSSASSTATEIGDVMLKSSQMTELYDAYISKLPIILEKLHNACKCNHVFEEVYHDFELQKVCYLPLTAFLLRPAHRLLHYCCLLERLTSYYNEDHPDFQNCKLALEKLQQVTSTHSSVLFSLDNYVKLIELQRDLIGLDNLIQPGRVFIREGCLLKLSRKGYQQRMFFLFSDVLLYTSRASTSHLLFKVHGQLPLEGVMVEETEPKIGMNHCFTIYGGNRALMVAACTQEEKQRWLNDLKLATQAVRCQKDDVYFNSSLHSCSSSDELLDKTDSHPAPHEQTTNTISEKHLQHRSNTTVHVCWHRNCSVSREDYRLAMVNYLSGYLLRKFKNSSGWQKLWVVFTNFCLFFCKSYHDDFPLASLPLLGYSISTPTEQDNINKDFVFKLQFRHHVYFFRAESEYAFNRWMKVIESATLRPPVEDKEKP